MTLANRFAAGCLPLLIALGAELAHALPASQQPRMDLDGDGRSDVLYRNASTGDVYRMSMNGFAVTGGAMVYREPNTDWNVVGDGDFNGDGVTDLLWRNAATGDLYLMPFDRTGVPSAGQVFAREASVDWKIVGTPDIDGDRRADILWWNSSTGQVYAMLMEGASIRAQGFVYNEPDVNWQVVAVGDFRGGGSMSQLVWRHAYSGAVSLMTITVTGSTFSQSNAIIYWEPSTPWKIVAAPDLDGDGRSDLLWRNEASGAVYGMLMSGATIAASAILYAEPNLQWKIAATGDYDGDGKADILWRHESTGQVYMMRMNGLAIAAAAMVYAEADTGWKVAGRYPITLGPIQPACGSADFVYRMTGSRLTGTPILRPGQTVSVEFTPQAGYLYTLSTREGSVSGADHEASLAMCAGEFAQVSPCAYYATSGAGNDMQAAVGAGYTVCSIQAGKKHYFNIRHVNPQNVSSCPTASGCGVLFEVK